MRRFEEEQLKVKIQEIKDQIEQLLIESLLSTRRPEASKASSRSRRARALCAPAGGCDWPCRRPKRERARERERATRG